MQNITVTLGNHPPRDMPEGTTVDALAATPADPATGLPYVGAMVNHDVSSLSYPLTVNSTVTFLTIQDSNGWRIYRNSLCFLLAKAVHETCPEARFSIEHSLGPGLYCSFSPNKASRPGISASQLKNIESRMRQLVEQDIPIERRKIAFTDAVSEFENSGQFHKLHLLKYRNPPRIVIHWCDGFSDLAHGPLVPRTGLLTAFQLLRYKPGFVLHLPDRSASLEMLPFEDQPHLFQIIQGHKEWGRIVGVETVGRLNEIIARGTADDFIRSAEILHEKKLGRIADQIAERHDKVKVVLISGPSCAGKTTFSKRLSGHLMVDGLRTITISVDDYFVGEERNPQDEDGKPDYEHIEAVDLDLFNEHLLALVNGREVEIPRFSFETKKRVYLGNKLSLSDDQVLIIEGIHGLNPQLTHMIPADRKFKVYVSALTQLSLDFNNRISTTDNRLIRRMVRDRKYRGHTALETLRIWPSVRRGEKRWIFPYQREADAMFNSALDYELAVLKPMVESLLMEVKPDHPEYAESRRLSEFLLNFLGTSPRAVPNTSILREYIGGSSFQY